MDKTFTKQLKKFVEKDNLSLNISVQNRQLVVSGSKSLVDILAENPECVQQLYDKILHKESDQKDAQPNDRQSGKRSETDWNSAIGERRPETELRRSDERRDRH